MANITLQKAHKGDEKILAYIQTESWKAAFSGILPPEELARYTELQRAEEMYKRVLEKGQVQMLIEFVDGSPHGIAAWGQNREDSNPDCAELICIHSLQDKWRRGYGSVMMQQLLAEMQRAGYAEVVLWVFKANTRARNFYEKHGFILTDRKKQDFGPTEVMYQKILG